MMTQTNEQRRAAQGAVEMLMAAARGEVNLSEQMLQRIHTAIDKGLATESREIGKQAARLDRARTAALR